MNEEKNLTTAQETSATPLGPFWLYGAASFACTSLSSHPCHPPHRLLQPLFLLCHHPHPCVMIHYPPCKQMLAAVAQVWICCLGTISW
ncbi:hypothetical protein L208DRAFT_278702 [Tricholoma matsutake]|nr:hypothetical protein L208DRAFT_278702 [Tricholoma matsutake 945]